MSEQTHTAGVPTIELRHRLALALEYGRITNDEMADHLGKSTTTVRNYLSGRTTPDRSTCRDWAMRCGVQLDWLLHGFQDTRPFEPDGLGVSRRACDGGRLLDFRARGTSVPSPARIAA